MDIAAAIADQLHSAGFSTKIITGNAVSVSLTSRAVNVPEVSAAMDQQHFNLARFELKRALGAVLVMWQ